jgi:flagellar assembly protein FliH
LFRIDKSFVDSININKEFVVITPKAVFENAQKQQPATEEERPPVTEQDILRAASAKAERTVEEATQAAEQIKKDAWQEGYQEGRKLARQEFDALVNAQKADASRVFGKIEAYKQELYRELLDSVLGLSFDIASKIINIQLEKDDTVYEEIAKAAIRALNSSPKFTLRVSRAEYERFFAEGGQWLQEKIGCAPFEVICDAYMDEGGCIAESDEGVVNAGVAEQMDKLRRMLEGGAGPDEVL